jgi:Bbp16-like protein
MITDGLLQLASAQAVTASAVSQNTIDLGLSRDAGAGEELFVVITVDQTVAAAGAATVQFQVITSASPNLSTPTVLMQTDAIAKTDLPAGRRPIVIELPRSNALAQPLGQRYLGLNFNVGTGPLTAGQFTVNVVHDVQDMGKFYPSAYTVA